MLNPHFCPKGDDVRQARPAPRNDNSIPLFGDLTPQNFNPIPEIANSVPDYANRIPGYDNPLSGKDNSIPQFGNKSAPKSPDVAQIAMICGPGGIKRGHLRGFNRL